MALSDWTASITALPLVETEIRAADRSGEGSGTPSGDIMKPAARNFPHFFM
jgi:hypothetical protein